MAFKKTCTTLAKVADDEPVFVIRAQDDLAMATILHWINLAIERGSPRQKTDEAMRCVNAIAEWRQTNIHKIPD